MSGNASISAAIRRRGVTDVGVANSIVSNENTEPTLKRLNYLDILKNHENRLTDVEILMNEKLLSTHEETSTNIKFLTTTNEENSTNIKYLMTTVEDLTTELNKLRELLNDKDDE
jgi:hypothetical protein